MVCVKAKHHRLSFVPDKPANFSVIAINQQPATYDYAAPRKPVAFSLNILGVQCDKIRTDHTTVSSSENISTGNVSTAPEALSGPQLCLLAGLAVGSILSRCCSVIHSPLLPAEAARHGLSPRDAGIISSCAALAEAITFPTMGWLVHRISPRMLYLFGVIVTGVATAALSWMSRVLGSRFFLAACMAMRVVESVGVAAMETSGNAITLSYFSGRKDTAVRLVGAVGRLVITPALGGTMHALSDYRRSPYSFAGFLIGGGLATTIALYAVPPSSTRKSPAERVKEHRVCDRLRVLQDVASCPDSWLVFVVMLTIAMNWWALNPSLKSHVSVTLGVGTFELGLMHAASLAAATFSYNPSGCG